MLSVRGIYEKGKVTLMKPIPNTEKVEVIVTVLENSNKQEKTHHEAKKEKSEEKTKLRFETLDPRQHIQSLKTILNFDFEDEENEDLPFSDIEDTNDFAKSLRDKAWTNLL